MSDHMEISSLFESMDFKEKQYSEVKYIQVNDQTPGQYDSGSVIFDTMPHRSHFSVLSESYLVLTGEILNATADSKYAVKSSILSFIQGLTVESSSGSTIVNEIQGSTSIVANLKLMLDSALDFRDANELHFAGHDKHISANVMRDLSIVGGASPTLSDKVPTIDPAHNPPLANRIIAWMNSSQKIHVNAGVYTQPFLVYIPLKFIHSWFAQMDWPCNNMPFKLTFNIAGTGGFTSMFPLVCPESKAHMTLGSVDAPVVPDVADPADATKLDVTKGATYLKSHHAAAAGAAAKPQIALGTPTNERGFATGVRLYLKTVKFHAEEAKKVAAMMTKGFDKKIEFNTSVFHRIPIRPGVPMPKYELSTQQVGASFIRPQRIWVLPVLADTLASEKNSFPSVISSKGQYLTNFNLTLGGENFYSGNIRSQYEFYRLLREQMVGEGQSLMWNTPITYTEFLNGVNPYCFDVSRSPLIDSNAAVDLTITTDIAMPPGVDVPDIDLIVIVERVETHAMNISTGGVVHTTVKGEAKLA